MTEDQMRDEVMKVYREGVAMRAPHDVIARAIGYTFEAHDFPKPASLLQWLEASGRWTRGTKH